MSDIHTLYHGSDRIVNKPLYGFGKEDNDYGSGFYTTEVPQRANEWAVANGNPVSAVCNIYEIDFEGLNILKLDEYGPLTWVAEIIKHRGTRSGESEILGEKIVEKYKIDTENADIIIGYRADDSYLDIVDAFLKNQISIDETERLFRKGKLGEQIFIKSKKAFEEITFKGYDNVDISKFDNHDEIEARIEVSRFLKQRVNSIMLSNYQPVGILARDAVENTLRYNPDTKYYEYCEEVDKEQFSGTKEGWEYGDD